MSVQKLRKDIQKARNSWDERSNFTLKGVRNLSPSDLDTLEMYLDTYESNGGNFSGLMDPLGEIKDVLDKYGIK